MPRSKKGNTRIIYGHTVTLTVAKRTTVKARLARGWPLELAVSTPPTPRGTRTVQKLKKPEQSAELFNIAWGRAAG